MSANCSWAVVPAAGSGNRFGQTLAKQYEHLHGKSILEHSINALLRSCPNISVYVAIASDDELWAKEAVATHPQVHRVSGGASRAESVQSGLEAVALKADNNDLVMVHDAARPCVSSEDILNLLSIAAQSEVGALLASPVTDTLKQVNEQQEVERTLDRRVVYQALTPQAFRIGVLLSALKRGSHRNSHITDEASALELAGYTPQICVGARSNIKVTFPEDLLFAAAYLGTQSDGDLA